MADVYNGWREAFRTLGVEVASFNLDDRMAFYASAGRMSKGGEFVEMLDEMGAIRLAAKGIEAACFEMWPDVLMVVSCFYIPLDLLDLVRARGIKVVLVHTEEPYEMDRELVRAAHADLNLLNDPTHLDTFKAVGPSVYMPHAYRPTLHTPGPAVASMASDFCFVGTGFPSRVTFLEAVDWSGIDVALGGMWQTLTPGSCLHPFVGHALEACMDNRETVDAYRSAKVGANLYRREGERDGLSEGWSMGPREVEMSATGLFFLRESRGEGDTVLWMLPRFDGPAEFEDKLRWYLARPDARSALADKAREAVIDRTFEANAQALLQMLGALNPLRP